MFIHGYSAEIIYKTKLNENTLYLKNEYENKYPIYITINENESDINQLKDETISEFKAIFSVCTFKNRLSVFTKVLNARWIIKAQTYQNINTNTGSNNTKNNEMLKLEGFIGTINDGSITINTENKIYTINTNNNTIYTKRKQY